MTLLLTEVVRFILGAAVWALIAAGVASVVAVTVWRIAGRPAAMSDLLGAAAAGLIAIGLAHRLSAPVAWSLEPFGRQLPMAWVAAGALAYTLFALSRRRAPETREIARGRDGPGAADRRLGNLDRDA